MYYILLEIRIGERFLEDSCCCYSQQVTSVVANASLVPYNLTKRTPETQNVSYCNHEWQPKPNQRNIKYSSVFGTKGFVSHECKHWKYV